MSLRHFGVQRSALGVRRSREARFPLPVSHARAPFTCTRARAALLAATLFAAGFTTAVYTIGLIITAR